MDDLEKLRQALARLLDATDPYVEEASPHETLFGPWLAHYDELIGARHVAEDALK